MADGLKPLKMSQPSRTISLKKMGRISTVKKGERGFTPNITRKAAASERVAVVLQEMEGRQNEEGGALIVEFIQRLQRVWQSVRPALSHRLLPPLVLVPS